MLCYNDPKSKRSETAIVCGRLSAADMTNEERYEFTLACGERQYDMRAETKAELDSWLGIALRVATENFLFIREDDP